jgi:hypothetical protein
MQNLSIQLEDWQQAALNDLARSRGVEAERMAHSILNERLIERIHTSFDDLVAEASPSPDSIEQRLKRLFDA